MIMHERAGKILATIYPRTTKLMGRPYWAVMTLGVVTLNSNQKPDVAHFTKALPFHIGYKNRGVRINICISHGKYHECSRH